MIRRQFTVRPGCIGRDFFYHPSNRRVDLNWAKELAKNMESVTMTRPDLEFIEIDGCLYILHGQHTITAISRFLDTSRKFDAKVFEAGDIEDIHEYLSAKHKGKIWRATDSLFIHKDKSMWPAIAARKGIDLSFAVTCRKGISYMALVTARLAANAMLRKQSASRLDGRTREIQVQLDLWTSADTMMIERTMDAAAWWMPLAKAAMEHRNITLFSSDILGIAIVIFETNTREALQITPSLFTADDGLMGLRGVMSMSLIVPRLLHALNYRKQKHLVSFFGENGRVRIAPPQNPGSLSSETRTT